MESVTSLLAQADAAWAGGDGDTAMARFDRAAVLAEQQEDLAGQAAAVLGLARGQAYNIVPGTLPIRLHKVYEAVTEPALRGRLAAALARCWSYANEPRRAQPFAAEALRLADLGGDPVVLADALDAALASHWGPDDLAARREWGTRLGDVAAHLADRDARLQAQLWALTVAWEVLDLPRIHRAIHAIELLSDESARAEFFAATRRLPIELLRMHLDVVPLLVDRAAAAAERAVIPDAYGVLHSMRGYAAVFAGDAAGCAAEAPAYEEYAEEFGVPAVRAEAAVLWLGARRLDKVAEQIGVFTPEVLANLPKDSDWLLIMQCVLEGALAAGDRDVAAAVVSLLTPYAGRSVVNAGGVMWHGVTDDTLARAYAMLGDAETAARHHAAALATYERIGATWWRDRLRTQLPADRGAGSAATGRRSIQLQEQPGGVWLIGRAGATFVLPRMRGLDHLHALLARPDADIPALRLAGVTTVEQAGIEMLDDEARRTLHNRLAWLNAELAEADNDEVRADEFRSERDAIRSYLRAGTALGGRQRTSGSSAERARVAVRKAIVSALAKIAEIDPWLGRHLADRIRTGFSCRYDSDPDHPVDWIL